MLGDDELVSMGNFGMAAGNFCNSAVDAERRDDNDETLSLLLLTMPPPSAIIVGVAMMTGLGSNSKRRFWISVLRANNSSRPKFGSTAAAAAAAAADGAMGCFLGLPGRRPVPPPPLPVFVDMILLVLLVLCSVGMVWGVVHGDAVVVVFDLIYNNPETH